MIYKFRKEIQKQKRNQFVMKLEKVNTMWNFD